MINKAIATINRDIDLLAPFVKSRLISALQECHMSGFKIAMFEGFRSPMRQEALYAQGRTTPGAIVTNAMSWQSWHNLGLAIDVAYFMNNRWSWSGDFHKPMSIFQKYGFEWSPKIELCHAQITCGFPINEAVKITKQHGLQTLWLLLAEKLNSHNFNK